MKKMKNKILFLSGLDFKEKSIQVIKKTPEAYRDAGWSVTYIVARDTSKQGNYYYEKPINLPNITIKRFRRPFPMLRDNLPHIFSNIVSLLGSLFVVFKLFFKGLKQIQKEKYDVIYGYEREGTVAALLIKIIFKNKYKYVSRFQGTFIKKYLDENNIKSIVGNMLSFIAMYFKTDLLIMTDDGTQGNLALEMIHSKNLNNYLFLKNGVDKPSLDSNYLKWLYSKYKKENEIILVSVSRLVDWKRIDRGIILTKILKEAKEKVKYLVVGEGPERVKLEKMVQDYSLEKEVIFVGAIKHEDVANYIEFADFFISFYDGSNVGNPLLEAINQNKIIVTLNNGDTAKIIKHKYNGYIYNPNTINYVDISKDLIECYYSIEKQTLLNKNIKKTCSEIIYSWGKRFDSEIKRVEELL